MERSVTLLARGSREQPLNILPIPRRAELVRLRELEHRRSEIGVGDLRVDGDASVGLGSLQGLLRP